MNKRINVTVDPQVHTNLDRLKELGVNINVSKVCSDALLAETARLLAIHNQEVSMKWNDIRETQPTVNGWYLVWKHPFNQPQLARWRDNHFYWPNGPKGPSHWCGPIPEPPVDTDPPFQWDLVR